MVTWLDTVKPAWPGAPVGSPPVRSGRSWSASQLQPAVACASPGPGHGGAVGSLCCGRSHLQEPRPAGGQTGPASVPPVHNRPPTATDAAPSSADRPDLSRRPDLTGDLTVTAVPSCRAPPPSRPASAAGRVSDKMEFFWRPEAVTFISGVLAAVATALLAQAAYNTLRLLSSLLVGCVLPRFTATDVLRHGKWAGETRAQA